MANEEQLAILKQGVEAWNKWRYESFDDDIDLSGANLSGANLQGAWLHNANLKDANLSGSNLRETYLSDAQLSRSILREADLTYADLIRADFTYADLGYAKLKGTTLSSANLTQANLTEANLSRANLEAANLTGADLSGANLSRANLDEVNLTGADLSGSNLKGAMLRNAKLSRAKLRGADLFEANLVEADLSEVDLNGADLSGAWLSWVNLSNADLRQADLSEAHLSEANLSRANLEDADLTGADLSGANLSHAVVMKADLKAAQLIKTNLTGADLEKANLSKANLNEADLFEANLTGANFSEAHIIKVNFSGANLSGAHLNHLELSIEISRSGGSGGGKLRAAEEPTRRTWDEVFFTAIYPREGKVETWHTLLVYAHLLSVIEDVFWDAERFQDQISEPKKMISTSPTRLVRGTDITIIPSCEGIVFNPERVVFKWMESYHRADFRFRADKSLSNDAARGQIDFYVGPLLVGTLKLAMLLNEEDLQTVPKQHMHSSMYHQEDIFVSYSHKDSEVVLGCKNAYQALGFNVLIDRETLRSGQNWNEELMEMIDRATIFQLFWSQNSRQSKYCRQEWEHALKRNKEGFIRPVYWEIPMPEPPEELNRYHFEYMQL